LPADKYHIQCGADTPDNFTLFTKVIFAFEKGIRNFMGWKLYVIYFITGDINWGSLYSGYFV
jgi:hypothetical protein